MRQGFTLVETLVAVTVFAVVVAIGIGGFARAVHTQHQVSALIAAQTNASIALEQMSREIRTGYLFCNDPANNGSPNAACATACSVSGKVWTCDGLLDFYNANSQNVDYRVGTDSSLQRSETGNAGTYVPITGGNVAVKYLTFVLFGVVEGDHWTPRVTISMGVAPSSTDAAISGNVLQLQTTVSARGIDCIQNTSSC